MHSGLVLQPDARTSAVLGDELNSCTFESALECVDSQRMSREHAAAPQYN